MNPQNATDPKLKADDGMSIDNPAGEGAPTPEQGSQPSNQGGQGQPQTPQPTPAPAPASQPAEGDDGDGSGEGDSPRFKERVTKLVETEKEKIKQEYEQQYGGAAKSWEAINKIAQKKPELALEIVQGLEEEGLLQAGSYETAKAKYEAFKKQQAEQQQPQQPAQPQGAPDPLADNPDIQFAKQMREQHEAEQRAYAEQQEKKLQDFETRYPEIGKSPNPTLTRQAIGLEAQRLIATGQAKDMDEALESAAKWTLRREDVLKEYKETGEINGMIRQTQEQHVTPPSGGGTPKGGGTRPLTPEEQQAKTLMGIKTDEEYLALLSPGAGIAE